MKESACKTALPESYPSPRFINKKRVSLTMEKRICKICGNVFMPRHLANNQKTCSIECSIANERLFRKAWNQNLKNRGNVKEQRRRYLERYKERIIKYRREYYKKNYERHLAYSKEYLQRPRYRIWRKNYMNKYMINRRRIDIQFYTLFNLRVSLRDALKRYGNGKLQSSMRYGIRWDTCCKKLLETKPVDFDERKYQIDHIRPLSSFDLTDPEQIKQAFAPENLQWLTAEENLRKGNKIM